MEISFVGHPVGNFGKMSAQDGDQYLISRFLLKKKMVNNFINIDP